MPLLHEWRLDLNTGATQERQLGSGVTGEFGIVHSSHMGRPTSLAGFVATASGIPAPTYGFVGVRKVDLATGAVLAEHMYGACHVLTRLLLLFAPL